MSPDRPRSGSQRIPRPADVRPGGPAPWEGLPAAERRITLSSIRRAMSTRLGGPIDDPSPPSVRSAGPTGVPGPDPSPNAGEAAAGSAVLMPFYAEADETHVVLTRRAQHLRLHRGEVSFPGGRREGSESPVAAACREAEEEIGLDRAAVEVIGQLEPVSTPSSGTGIVPVVGLLSGRPELVANPNEVEAILLVPLAELLADGVFREELWPITPDGDRRSIYFFEIAGDTIWGATARLLRQLFVRVLAT